MVKMLKKSSLLSKIAMIVSILSMIVAISNIFVQSEKLRVIVWCMVIIVLSLDCWSSIKDNFELMNHISVLVDVYIRSVAALGRVQLEIDHMDLPGEQKKILNDYIDSEVEEIKALEEQKLKEFKIDEN